MNNSKTITVVCITLMIVLYDVSFAQKPSHNLGGIYPEYSTDAGAGRNNGSVVEMEKRACFTCYNARTEGGHVDYSQQRG